MQSVQASVNKELNFLRDATLRYAHVRSRCLPLVASENSLSPAVAHFVGNRISERYMIRGGGMWCYPLQEELARICSHVEDMTARVFGGCAASISCLSGSQCVAALTCAAAASGATVLGINAEDGGHWALRDFCEARQIRHEGIPHRDGAIDLDRLQSKCAQLEPAFVMVDYSHAIRRISVSEIREAVGDRPVFVDISHFMGLVPYAFAETPLRNGATIVHGSTHKSFPGPQKGIIVFADDCPRCIVDATRKYAEKVLVSNVHMHHILALGAAVVEHEMFGRRYAHDVVLLANAVAEALSGLGEHVRRCDPEAFTHSHQVWIDLGTDSELVLEQWKRLEEAGLLCNPFRIPGDQAAYGLRLGVAELARRGFTSADANDIASLVVDVLRKRRAIEHVSQNVQMLAAARNQFSYCFTE
jgi:glycine hydroxymethyltransferase